MDEMNEMDALRRLWAGTPDGSAADLAGSRALMERAYVKDRQEDRRARGPRRILRSAVRMPGPLFKGMAAVTVAAAVVVATQLVPGAVPPASAQELLARAADAASEQTELKLRPGQYLHVRSVAARHMTVGRKDGTGVDHLAIKVAEDTWEPAEPGKPWLVREEPKGVAPYPGSRPVPSVPGMAGVDESVYESSCDKTPGDELSYLRLGEWPTDVAALRARIEKVAAQQEGPGHLRLWLTISDLIKKSAARPSLAAPLFEVASSLEGITLVPDVTDAAGRPGMAVGMAEDETMRSELVFDKETYRYLGIRYVVTKDRTENPGGRAYVVPRGTATGTALLGVEAADAMPEPSPQASRLRIPC
ncbi:CU044_5270 family protein [Nonomuraea sp. bgisy101]|uniref:CU044_5270 family protein n=1 Tax=Nonomuraea sp. bgisy101 TaxID=3413784 RepID=UPI003D71EFA0